MSMGKGAICASSKRQRINTKSSTEAERVKCPDQDDIKKLGRTMRYLRFTQQLPLTLEANGLTEANWWVDASFATHHDM